MVSLNINNKDISFEVDEDTPLLWAIRDEAHLTGTKYGCGLALCGACTIYLDNQPIRSCITPVAAAVGKKITTIEGLESKESQAIQQAWKKLDVPQCGYCQSGQIMSATALLKNNKSPNDNDIDAFMSGNICRCVTYVRIRAAIKEAAKNLV